jgi:regulator of replication initiation timing
MVAATRLGTSAMNESKFDISMSKDHATSGISESRTAGDKEAYLRQQVEQLSGDLSRAYRERDEAKRNLEQLTQENEELRKGLPEYARLKALYESLKQDHEAVKTSLESSERIRLQQKELIQILQRTNNIAGDSSIASVQSISSISQKGDNSSIQSLTAMIGSSQPSNSIFSGMPSMGEAPNWMHQSSAPTFTPSYGIGAPMSAPVTANTAMKARRAANEKGVVGSSSSSRKARVVVSSNNLTRKKSSHSGAKQKDSKSSTPATDANKKKKKASIKTPAGVYERMTQDLSSNGNSFQDILGQNQSLLSVANLQALQQFHNGSSAPSTPFMQQMMQNQAATEQSSSLLAAIQAQQLQQYLSPSSAVPQNPEVSAAKANVAAGLASSGKPPRYPTAHSPGITGTVLSSQPIYIPTAGLTGALGNNRPVSKTPVESSFASSQQPKLPGSATRGRSPASGGRQRISAPSPASKKSSGSKSKTQRKSTVESPGPTKVLYRPIPSPASSFGTSKRM